MKFKNSQNKDQTFLNKLFSWRFWSHRISNPKKKWRIKIVLKLAFYFVFLNVEFSKSRIRLGDLKFRCLGKQNVMKNPKIKNTDFRHRITHFFEEKLLTVALSKTRYILKTVLPLIVKYLGQYYFTKKYYIPS